MMRIFRRLHFVPFWLGELLLLLVISVSCGFDERPSDKPAVLSSQVTILPQSEFRYAVAPCSRKGPDGESAPWLPQAEDVIAAERRLNQYISRRLDRPLSNYYRQYTGIVINNRRFLYINAFEQPPTGKPAAESLPEWRTRFVAVCDGGDVSWGIEFDVEGKNFRNFSKNAVLGR